ncbi:MAG TPA: discoidin domain-containing protein [Chthoniobacteraceae bacterium]|nr:discoidin domain-containing protein [Chthoniobacteraceae bacterium]
MIHFCLAAFLLLSVAVHGSDAEPVNRAEGRAYTLSAGAYFKAEGFGTEMDKDLVDPENPDAGRKMLLTGGAPSAHHSPVIYSFWKAPEEDSFINIGFDLEEPRTVTEVVVFGVNHTRMYGVRSIVIEASEDGLVYDGIAHLEPVEQPETGAWKASVPIKEKTRVRHLRVVVFARESAHLGLSAIEINGPGE